jgi:hypothetical protein
VFASTDSTSADVDRSDRCRSTDHVTVVAVFASTNSSSADVVVIIVLM